MNQTEREVQVVAISHDNRSDHKYIKPWTDKKGNKRKGFYKFPVKGSFPKKRCKYIAFYISDHDHFKDERRGISYYAKILSYERMKRKHICDKEEFLKRNKGANNRLYYKIIIDRLNKLNHKIQNSHGQRVAYRYTTLAKLLNAKDVCEL